MSKKSKNTEQQKAEQFASILLALQRKLGNTDDRIEPADHANTLVGADAVKSGSYTTLPDGTAFSMGIRPVKDKRFTRRTRRFIPSDEPQHAMPDDEVAEAVNRAVADINSTYGHHPVYMYKHGVIEVPFANELFLTAMSAEIVAGRLMIVDKAVVVIDGKEHPLSEIIDKLVT